MVIENKHDEKTIFALLDVIYKIFPSSLKNDLLLRIESEKEKMLMPKVINMNFDYMLLYNHEIKLPNVWTCTIGSLIDTDETINQLATWDGMKLFEKPITIGDIKRLGFVCIDSDSFEDLKLFTTKNHDVIVKFNQKKFETKIVTDGETIKLEKPTLGQFIDVVKKTGNHFYLSLNISNKFPDEQGNVVILRRGCLSDNAKHISFDKIDISMFCVPLKYFRNKNMVIFIDNDGSTKLIKSRYGNIGNVK